MLASVFSCSCFSELRDTCLFSGEAAFSLFYEFVLFYQPVSAIVILFSTIWLGKTVADCTAVETRGGAM